MRRHRAISAMASAAAAAVVAFAPGCTDYEAPTLPGAEVALHCVGWTGSVSQQLSELAARFH